MNSEKRGAEAEGLNCRDHVRRFREMVKNQSNLRSRTDDNFLLRFLRHKQCELKGALEMLRNYYDQRLKYPEIYKDLRASSMPHVLAVPNMGPLPSRDPKGRTIFVVNSVSLWDPAKVSVDDGIRYFMLSFERLLEDEHVQRNGAVAILDVRGFGLKYLDSIGPSHVIKAVSICHGSFPIMFSGAYFVNCGALFRIFYAMVRPFLGVKLQSQIRLYGSDLTDFHRSFPPEILPREFGGRLGPFDNKDWNKQLLDYDREMDLNLKFGYLK